MFAGADDEANAPPSPVERLLSAHEVAEWLGVKPGWVLAEARANRIPHLYIGRYPRFEKARIKSWFAELRRGPEPPA